MALINDPPRMDDARNHMSGRILELTLEIIYWITGEDYTVVKKSSGELVTPRVSGGRSRTPSPITDPPPHSLIHEQEILELASWITELLTGEVPIRCQDVAVYFSMEEWEYLEGHRDLEDTFDMMDLTLEIIHLITGEDYTVVKKSSGKCVTPRVSGGRSRTPSPITDPLPHSLIHVQKILELTSGITELLTGEIPIRCQDVAVYFSMEEWEYLEGHKDLYKDIVMMEDQQPLTSPDGSSQRNPPERCPSPLYSQDCKEEEQNVPLDHQVVIGTILQESSPFSPMEGSTSSSPGHPESDDETIIDLEKPVSVKCERWIRDSQGLLVLSPHREVEHDHASPGNSTPPYETIVLQISDLSTDTAGQQEPSSHRPRIAKQRSGQKPSLHEGVDTVERPFVCSECGKTFRRKINLELHHRIHTGERPYSCTVCGKRFTQTSGLREHQRTHTGEKPYACTVCGKRFTYKTVLVDHLKIHTGEKPFTCLECGKRFSQKPHLKSHERVHTGEKPFPCSECGKCFSHKSNLNEHLKIHTGEKPFSCLECGKCFSDKKGLVKHHRTHTGEKPFSCSECGKCFTDRKGMVKHQKIHVQDKPFSCTECGRCFIQKSKLLEHVRVHSGEKPFSCPECDKCFRKKSNLMQHQRLHTGENPFMCPYCDKCYSIKSSLVLHLRTHTGEKPFSCLDCGKSFSHRSSIALHQRTHTGEKSYSCTVCEKSFTQKSNLNSHQRTHTGQKPFSCPECEKCFSQKSSLVKHQKTHTEEKGFICPGCGKCFSQESDLLAHEKTHHTEEKGFSCPECGERFSQKSDVIAHLTVHSE